jgi:hypothetical protein
MAGPAEARSSNIWRDPGKRAILTIVARVNKEGNPGMTQTRGQAALPSAPSDQAPPSSRFSVRLHAAPSAEDAEAAYVAARDAWTVAMRAASSGRAADLASLALTQETYEAAAAERERWLAAAPSSGTALNVGEGTSRAVEIVVGQELEWRRVKDLEPRNGFGARIKRLLGR